MHALDHPEYGTAKLLARFAKIAASPDDRYEARKRCIEACRRIVWERYPMERHEFRERASEMAESMIEAA